MTLTYEQAKAIARAPLPTVRYIPGKSWAGRLVNRLDDPFSEFYLSRPYSGGRAMLSQLGATEPGFDLVELEEQYGER